MSAGATITQPRTEADQQAGADQLPRRQSVTQQDAGRLPWRGLPPQHQPCSGKQAEQERPSPTTLSRRGTHAPSGNATDAGHPPGCGQQQHRRRTDQRAPRHRGPRQGHDLPPPDAFIRLPFDLDFSKLASSKSKGQPWSAPSSTALRWPSMPPRPQRCSKAWPILRGCACCAALSKVRRR
ncbi:protein of unknown function [Stenotrophomonas maltophilia]|nr:protein of unknown function [Stenotrophomonas maltophilia]